MTRDIITLLKPQVGYIKLKTPNELWINSSFQATTPISPSHQQVCCHGYRACCVTYRTRVSVIPHLVKHPDRWTTSTTPRECQINKRTIHANAACSVYL